MARYGAKSLFQIIWLNVCREWCGGVSHAAGIPVRDDYRKFSIIIRSAPELTVRLYRMVLPSGETAKPAVNRPT